MFKSDIHNFKKFDNKVCNDEFEVIEFLETPFMNGM